MTTQAVHINGWWNSLRHTALHACFAMLAVGIAFAIPQGAEYILYQWWPKVIGDTDLLLATEITLAAVLALLFNISRIAWDNRFKVRIAEAASLVYARDGNARLARHHERLLLKNLPAIRDASILTLSGFDMFAGEGSLLREPLSSACEIRVMLLNPASRSAARRIDSLPGGVTMDLLTREIEASIEYLGQLRGLGKKVTLKFYDDVPFWKVAVLGDHVWVQFCHNGVLAREQPEYVFAMNRNEPQCGLFVPFYMYFLDYWSHSAYPEFDFNHRVLVYRDEQGAEVERVVFGEARHGEKLRLKPQGVNHSSDEENR